VEVFDPERLGDEFVLEVNDVSVSIVGEAGPETVARPA
jgi:hypothetical protein